MKNIMIFLLFCCLIAGLGSAHSQNFQIDRNSVGLIAQDGDQILGTGFICTYGNLIITCAHLFEHVDKVDSFSFKTMTGDYKAKVVYLSFDKDIAILKLDTLLVDTPITLAKEFKFHENEPLALSGWDIAESLIQDKQTVNVSPVNVSGYHEVTHGNNTRKLLEFYGIAQPGYSGGPIFKWDGKVYAMLQGGMPNIKEASDNGKTLNIAIILDDLYIIFDFLTFQGLIGS